MGRLAECAFPHEWVGRAVGWTSSSAHPAQGGYFFGEGLAKDPGFRRMWQDHALLAADASVCQRSVSRLQWLYAGADGLGSAGLSEEAAAALRESMAAALSAAAAGEAPTGSAADEQYGREMWARCEALTTGEKHHLDTESELAVATRYAGRMQGALQGAHSNETHDLTIGQAPHACSRHPCMHSLLLGSVNSLSDVQLCGVRLLRPCTWVHGAKHPCPMCQTLQRVPCFLCCYG